MKCVALSTEVPKNSVANNNKNSQNFFAKPRQIHSFAHVTKNMKLSIPITFAAVLAAITLNSLGAQDPDLLKLQKEVEKCQDELSTKDSATNTTNCTNTIMKIVNEHMESVHEDCSNTTKQSSNSTLKSICDFEEKMKKELGQVKNETDYTNVLKEINEHWDLAHPDGHHDDHHHDH